MKRKNKYANRAKISEGKFRELVKLFAYDLDASQIAKVTGLNRNTVNRYLKEIRKRVAAYCEEQSPFSGGLRVERSYLVAGSTRGQRGRKASGKTNVLGISRMEEKIYTEIVADCERKALQAAIRGNQSPDSSIHSTRWRGYDGLVDLGHKKHFRLQQGNDQSAQGKSYINVIESFWAYAKTRLSKFRGLSRSTFYLHLKECEFRFNHRGEDRYATLLKICREKPLF